MFRDFHRLSPKHQRLHRSSYPNSLEFRGIVYRSRGVFVLLRRVCLLEARHPIQCFLKGVQWMNRAGYWQIRDSVASLKAMRIQLLRGCLCCEDVVKVRRRLFILVNPSV
jgi:hypothetical protein